MNFTTKADELYDARVALLLGNYETAIAEVQNVANPHGRHADAETLRAEKTALTALAYVGLGNFAAAQTELTRATAHAHLATLATLLDVLEALHTSGGGGDNSRDTAAADGRQHERRADVQSRIDALVADAAAAHDVRPETTYLVKYAAMALLESSRSSNNNSNNSTATSNSMTALRLCQRWLQRLPTQHASPQAEVYVLELHALVVEALLSLHCVDEAHAQVQRMYAVNDNAPLTLLCAAAVALCAGQRLLASRDAFVQALDALHSVQLQFGHSTRVLNLMALAHMGLRDYAAAERALSDALALRANDATTLANLAVVSAQLGKSADVTERFVRLATQSSVSSRHRRSSTDNNNNNNNSVAAMPSTALLPSVSHATVRQQLDEAVAQFAAAATTTTA